MRKLIFALALGALLLPNYGFTLGLGEIEVNSALNQELNAEIELLSASPEDAEKLIVRLASREEFSRAGLDRPYMLSDLQFSTVVKNGKPWISVRTSKPVREPFLNFLLEIDWPKGHLLREYTILLDPPTFMEKAPDDTYRPAKSESSSAGQAPVQSGADAGNFRPAVNATAARPSSSAAPAGQSTSQAVAGTQFRYQTGGYRIKTGDTAWSLAESMRPDQSISIEQMMMAMLRSNPEAFIDENVNGLKRGYILRLPDTDEITSMSQAESLALVRQQNALWRDYQQTLEKGKPASAMDTGTAAGAGAGVEQAPGARLAIVAAGSGAAASGMKDPSLMNESELRAELVAAREALESGLVEKEELQSRVESLEGQVDRMKSLLTLEDTDMAGMQMQGQETPSDQAPMGEDVEQSTEQAQTTEETGSMVEETMTETGMQEESAAAEDTGEIVTEEQVFVDEQAQVEGAESEDMTQPSDQVEPYAVTEIPPQQKGLLASLLGNPVLLAGVGGGLLLVIVLIVLIIKRRGVETEPEMAASLAAVTDIEEVADMVADEDVDTRVSDEEVEEHMAAVMAEAEGEENVEDSLAVEESYDADSTLILPGMEDATVTQTPEQIAEMEDEGDDVTAEADVYLAYGIYQQAEELLKNAIRENPDRDAYRVKLAETYYASKNADAFAEMATEMHDRLAGAETPSWKKVAAIGKELCPDHELFKDAEMASDLNMDDLVQKSPEPMDIDLGAAHDDTLMPDLDIGQDMAEEEPETSDLEQAAALGLTTKEPEEQMEEEGVEFDLTETEAIEPEDDEEFSLDIEASELDIQDEETPEGVTDVETGIDFNLDIGAETESQTAAEETAVEVTPEDETAALDIDAGEIDFDINAEEETPETEQVELDEAESAGDETALDFDLGSAEEIAIETEAEDAVEEAGINLDLEADEKVADEEVAVETAAIANELDEDEDIDLSMMLDDVDEVSTKLDLARAYLDMGDAEGTRSILDEVIADGNDEQKQEAEELLNQLAS